MINGKKVAVVMPAYNAEKTLLKMLEGRCDWLDPDTYVRKDNGRVVAAGIGETDYTIGNGGTLMMPACACRNGQDLYLALSGEEPAVWINGQSIPLPLNGYLTSVTVFD